MTAMHLELHTHVRQTFGAAKNWWTSATNFCWTRLEFCCALLLVLKDTESEHVWSVMYNHIDQTVVQDPVFVSFVKAHGIVDATILSTCLGIVGFTEDRRIKNKVVGRSLAFAPREYLSNPDVMIAWYLADNDALHNYGDRASLQSNKLFMINMLQQKDKTWSFETADISLRADPEFILAGFACFGGQILNHVPDTLKANVQFCTRMLLKQHWITPVPHAWQFRFLSNEIKTNVKAVEAALAVSPLNIAHVSRILLSSSQGKRKWIMNAIAHDPALYTTLPLKYQNDVEVAMLVAKNHTNALKILTPSMKTIRTVVAVGMCVKVPLAAKWQFLYGCCVDRRGRKYSLWSTNALTGTIDVHIQPGNNVILSRLERQPKVRRGRDLLCGLGCLGRGVLELIFQFAAWKSTRRPDLLCCVDYDLAKEWCDDYDQLFFNRQDRLARRAAAGGGDGDEDDDEEEEEEEPFDNLNFN